MKPNDTSVRRNFIRKESKMVQKGNKLIKICYEVVSYLEVCVGQKINASTNIILNDTEDYRLFSRQLRRRMSQKDPNLTWGV